MDYKYIEQLMERYWEAETTLEEENILRTFFSQKDIPAEMEQWRPLFSQNSEETLDDDFDIRMLEAIADSTTGDSRSVKAREAKLTVRLMPLFKAAAIVAIILTLGGALQAPWDSTWDNPQDYAKALQQVDTIATVSPVQAANVGEVMTDSTKAMVPEQPTD